MNLKDIDKLFNEHQHQFDKMPSDKLWERLEEKLDSTPAMWREEKPTPKVRWMRYVAAAAVILVMMVPAIYFTNAPQDDLAMEHSANYSESPAENNPSMSSADAEMNSDTAMSLSRENNSPNTEIAVKEERKEKENPIAAKSRDNNKGKPKFISKNKTTIAPNFNQQTPNQTIEKPTIVTATPKPSISTTSRNLTMPAPSKPSMSADSDIAIKEEVSTMEIEEDAGMSFDEVAVSEYGSSAAKTSKPTAKFDITNTNGTYAYARYNANVNSSYFSNALPYDGYGDERLSQSTLEIESAKEIQSTKAGSAKKSKDKSSDNVALKRNASKADIDDALSAKSLGFLYSLEGNWSLYLNGMFFEENWKMTPNGILLGTAKTLQNGAILFAEDLSIHPLQGDKMTYTINHPDNSQSLTYQLRTSETSTDNENYLIFYNLQNDFPRTVTYRLMNIDMLQITFEGQKEGKPLFKELILNRF